MMRVFAMLLCGLFGCASASASADEYSQRLAASRATVAEFMQTLKRELQKGMQDGGPVNAISVCNLTAPAIANTYSVRKGWDVGRTSLRLRNPDNAPDAWEQAVLESFEERKQAGEAPADLEYWEVVMQDGEPVFRYMKAIPTTELCTACHGQHVDQMVKERLRKLYPHDRALGFRPGDIRGAFTVTQPLAADREE
ncbi:MAG: DUF3365 domain-containing protein [Gammaproteobacteria bacterium]|jgi:hypothetical protein